MSIEWNRLLSGIGNRIARAMPLLGTALLALFVSSSPAASQTYDIVNIGGLGGSGSIAITGISPRSEVLGYASVSAGGYHAFYATPADGTIDIGTLGDIFAAARYVNAYGQVIGTSCSDPGDDWLTCRAFSWTRPGGIVSLGTLGGAWSTVAGIADTGVVAGTSELSGGDYHAFSWTQAHGMVDLGTLGGRLSWAYGVNALGQIIGFAYKADGSFHAVVWQPDGTIVDLGVLDRDDSLGYMINDAGQAVGYLDSVTSGSLMEEHPFFWTPSTGMIDLGTLGGVYAWPQQLNASGRVVGGSLTAANDFRYTMAFTWTQADGLVQLSLGGDGSVASGLSSAGHVVGWSRTRSSGAAHPFLWTQADGIVDLGGLGGSGGAAASVNKWGQVVGYAGLPGDTQQHAFLYDGGLLKDLNDIVTSKPAGMEIWQAWRVLDNKTIAAWSNAGTVLLVPSSTTAAPPALGPITSNDPVAVGAALSVSANFTDAPTDTHTASCTFGDGTSAQPGTISEVAGSGTISATHAYAAAGVYPVSVTVTDNTGKSSQVSRNVVVYDPSAGFVTGSGWIDSPAGAFKTDATVAGRATFGFVSQYQKGAKVPTGTTEFHFQTANLAFHSDAYDWLVVAGARAQFKGEGSLNATAGYQFLLTAIDGQMTGGGGKDRFRIKIWHYDATLQQDIVDYDNQLDASTDGTLSEGTAISSGSIVIHTSTK